MKREKLYRAIGDIDMRWVAESEHPRKKKRARARWGALAACLCLMAAAPLLLWALNTFPFSSFPTGGGSGPPNITIDGRTFCVSSHVSVSSELPDGFALAGETTVADSGLGDCPYYLNPDIPEWVYVYHEVNTDGTLDALGHLNRTEPHKAYVRYVDRQLRGKDLLCYQGDLYISMWSADYYGDDPDVSEAYHDEMEERFGARIEGDASDGFVSVGIATFSGDDTIPTGTLSSNQGQAEVYCSPNEPDVALVRTHWFTSTKEESGETRHEGFDVYIRYDAPLNDAPHFRPHKQGRSSGTGTAKAPSLFFARKLAPSGVCARSVLPVTHVVDEVQVITPVCPTECPIPRGPRI